ncbi:MAG: hypothetical protein E6471_30160, partial [Bradyrhizobium sp.]|nr:hypothetical protein [Bradyrhizobium sp.]
MSNLAAAEMRACGDEGLEAAAIDRAVDKDGIGDAIGDGGARFQALGNGGVEFESDGRPVGGADDRIDLSRKDDGRSGPNRLFGTQNVLPIGSMFQSDAAEKAALDIVDVRNKTNGNGQMTPQSENST